MIWMKPRHAQDMEWHQGWVACESFWKLLSKIVVKEVAENKPPFCVCHLAEDQVNCNDDIAILKSDWFREMSCASCSVTVHSRDLPEWLLGSTWVYLVRTKVWASWMQAAPQQTCRHWNCMWGRVPLNPVMNTSVLYFMIDTVLFSVPVYDLIWSLQPVW